MSTTTDHPVVFISYSWSSPEHEDWVIKLATDLRVDGVDVRLDKWHLKPGHDKYAFMESMVTDPNVSRVLVICDRRYKEKADARAGGVGTESQIISAEVYGKVGQGKFLPVVTELDDEGKPCLPVFMKSRIYIDLSSADRYAEGYEHLLREIYERPLRQIPQLGKMPGHLAEGAAQIEIKTLPRFRAFREALLGGKPQAVGCERSFLQAFVDALEDFRVTNPNQSFDDDIVATLDAMKPYRDQFVEYLLLKCDFAPEDFTAYKALVTFFEKLGSYYFLPRNQSPANELWCDNYHFLGRELLICMTAALIRSRKEGVLARFLHEKFVIDVGDRTRDADFTFFDGYPRALDEHRNRRLQLGRKSVSADMLKNRATQKELPHSSLMEADFVLTLRFLLGEPPIERGWFPRSLVFMRELSSPLPVFARNATVQNREVLCALLSVSSPKRLVERFEEAKKQHRNFEGWNVSDWERLPFEDLMNLDVIKRLRGG